MADNNHKNIFIIVLGAIVVTTVIAVCFLLYNDMHNSSQYELVDYTLLETQGACDINSNPNDPGGIDIDLNHKPDLTPDQQYQLGLKYYFGEQHEQDYDEAIKWFKLAASNDKVEAQMQLANMYYYGDGVEQNKSEAAEWLNKAVKHNNTEAIIRLSDLYYEETGTTYTIDSVIAYYQLILKAKSSHR